MKYVIKDNRVVATYPNSTNAAARHPEADCVVQSEVPPNLGNKAPYFLGPDQPAAFLESTRLELVDGRWQVAPPPPPNPETAQAAIKASFTEGVQARLDAEAQAHGYDNILSASSYAACPNEYQAEGQAFLEWRAATWSAANAVLNAVLAGEREIPTPDEFVAALPEYTGP